MKTLFKGTLALSLLASSFLAVPVTKAQDIVSILTCPYGCGVMEGNTIFGNVVARSGGSLFIAAQETPGYMYNVRVMTEQRRWKHSVFGTEDAIIQLALQGGSEDLKEYLPDPIPIKFQLLHGEAYWSQGKFFVTTDPNIKTIPDMKGKRVSIGLLGQSDWGVFPALFLKHAYGIDSSNTDIRRLNPGGLTQQLIDGTTDVCVTGYGTDPTQTYHLPSGPLRKLEASGKKLYYIPMDQWAIDKMNEQFGTTWLGMTIKAGTLPHQDQDFLAGFNRGYKAVHPEFPEQLAYDYVTATHKHLDEMRELNALWKVLTEDMMVDGLSEENTHPGAIRAYKDLGIWDKRLNFVPVTYPES